MRKAAGSGAVFRTAILRSGHALVIRIGHGRSIVIVAGGSPGAGLGLSPGRARRRACRPEADRCRSSTTRKKEISFKIVYYGPGVAGKTANLQYIHRSLPDVNRGKMISLATGDDRTLFFDFLPVSTR